MTINEAIEKSSNGKVYLDAYDKRGFYAALSEGGNNSGSLWWHLKSDGAGWMAASLDAIYSDEWKPYMGVV